MLGKVLNENSKLKGKTQKENQEALAKISKAAPFTFAQPRLMQEPAIGNKRRREDQGQRTYAAVATGPNAIPVPVLEIPNPAS